MTLFSFPDTYDTHHQMCAAENVHKKNSVKHSMKYSKKSIRPLDSRLPELDILRVIAAAFVLLYHFTFREPIVHEIPPTTFPSLNIVTRYGFLGVQLFFLISGFVILMSAEQRSALAFIKSRAKRLYPTFWIACTITFLSMLTFGAPILKATWPQYWLNMTLLTDFFREYAIDQSLVGGR